MRSSLEVYDLATGKARVILQSDDLIEAPNWDPLNRGFLVNGDGGLFWVPMEAPRLVPLETGVDLRCNNDHGFSRDGSQILFCGHRGQGAEMFAMPFPGGSAAKLVDASPSWFHGTAPDGSGLVYVAARGARTVVDVYTKSWNGPEQRLTFGEGHCDGPDFAADGRSIYYNCDRAGHAQIWVMQADGSDQRQLFADDHVNWFPHPSPDGRHVVYLAYPPGTEGHPRDLEVALCLMDVDGGNRRRIVEMTGGQGSLNVPCWAPDGQAFAYMRYALAE